MSDYLAHLSGFEAVMWTVAVGALGLGVYLAGCVRRLDQLAADQLADELVMGAQLTPEELDTIRRVADRLRGGQEVAREDKPA